MIVLDSSALLAFLQGEQGGDRVEELLDGETSCGAANWSEVAQRVVWGGRDWPMRRALLLGYDLVVEPVTTVDAERAADLWRHVPTLSLGDRLCLALGDRLDAEVWTADTSWGQTGRIHQIR